MEGPSFIDVSLAASMSDQGAFAISCIPLRSRGVLPRVEFWFLSLKIAPKPMPSQADSGSARIEPGYRRFIHPSRPSEQQFGIFIKFSTNHPSSKSEHTSKRNQNKLAVFLDIIILKDVPRNHRLLALLLKFNHVLFT